MKNNIKKIFIILFVVISLTGCAKTLTNGEKQVVTNPETGQRLTENILCKPKNETVKKIYLDNNVNIEKLPECDKFSVVSGGYEGIWTTIFVKPVAWLIILIGNLVKNYGLSIIIITFLIRLILYPITKKTALQSELLKKAQPEMNKIEKKYQNKTSQEAQIQKSQEMMMVYKKYKINPLSGCIFSIIQIPLFFAFYEAMQRVPALFEENLIGFQLGTSPATAISQGKFYYIIFIVLVVVATYFSFKLNKTATMGAEQEKQMKMMTNISTILIGIASITMSTGIELYWIFNSGFTILQNLLVRRGKKNDNII
ncbi:MAG: YidC/Oxa1 family membrane protein insertase [Clostridium sp.]|nr:YidC/Oxa1 family membrane protein insertase [Clostridium sp.]MCM1443766.1 YidC/Oxa1 family membrane protein insertase [Candidatus Amulumruptor caecigallinarius]